jgi:hypothetical protein
MNLFRLEAEMFLIGSKTAIFWRKISYNEDSYYL